MFFFYNELGYVGKVLSILLRTNACTVYGNISYVLRKSRIVKTYVYIIVVQYYNLCKVRSYPQRVK